MGFLYGALFVAWNFSFKVGLSGECSVLACLGLALPPRLFLNQLSISGVGLRQLQSPTCWGTSTAQSVATASSRTCVVWLLAAPGTLGRSPVWLLRTLPIPDSIYKKTSWGLSAVSCAVALSTIVSILEVSLCPLDHHDLDHLLGHRQVLRL